MSTRRTGPRHAAGPRPYRPLRARVAYWGSAILVGTVIGVALASIVRW